MESIQVANGGKVLRVLAALLAAGFLAGSVIYTGLLVNAFGTPPSVPDAADLPTRLLASKPFDQQIWPFDLASSLLYALGFAALALIGAILPSFAGAASTSARAFGAALVIAGVLGLAAELIYVGGRSAVVNIGYCDCGFKNEEAISQLWAMNIVQGAQSWLINGAALLLAAGIAGFALELGERLVSTRWAWFSLVAAALGTLAAVLQILDIARDASTILTGVTAGILVPIWAIWLGWTAGARNVAAIGGMPEASAGGAG